MEVVTKELLESYNLSVLRHFARRHLPQPSKDEVSRQQTYHRRQYLVMGASKYRLVAALLPYVNGSVKSELDELQQYDILRKEGESAKKHRFSKTHQEWCLRYHREVVTPRKKATREFMREHPELVAEIRRKHGLS